MIEIRRDAAKIAKAQQEALLAVKEQLVDLVNVDVARARAKLVTSVLGQDAVYQEKVKEAADFVSRNYPVSEEYPFLQAEVGTLADTAYEVAQIWLNSHALWATKAAALEGLRAIANLRITNAADKQAAHDTLELFYEDLHQFQTQ